jgi:4-hydroxybenzoate polyprenyltransferase
MTTNYKDIIQLMRPRQWMKNLFIFLPLFFSYKYY